MRKKIIRLNKSSQSDAKRAIQQWIKLYSEDLPNDFKLTLHSHGDLHFIDVDQRLDNDRFYYLINYLKYPENINYNAQVEGMIIGKERKLKGQELLIYLDENDKEYDNVFAVNKNNKHFKIDFGGRIYEVHGNKKFESLQLENSADCVLFRIRKKRDENKEDLELDERVQKRFKVIFIVAVVLFITNLFIPFISDDSEAFMISTLALCFGIAFWFFIDYEMLRFEFFQMVCFMISAGLIAYGYVIEDYSGNYNSIQDLSIYSHPMVLLLVQWPIRHLYKVRFKREPKVDKNGSFPDLIYTVLLFISLSILPSILIDYFFT